MDGCSIQPKGNSYIQQQHITDQCGKVKKSMKLPVYSDINAKEKHIIHIEKVYLCYPSCRIK